MKITRTVLSPTNRRENRRRSIGLIESIAPLFHFGTSRPTNRVNFSVSASFTRTDRVIVFMNEPNRLKRGTGAPRSHPASFPRPSGQRFQAGSVDRLNIQVDFRERYVAEATRSSMKK